MLRLLRVGAFLGVSLSLACALSGTAWALPQSRREGYRAKFVRAWSIAVCRILRIRVDVVGDPPPAGRRLVACNHLGYADIPVLGSVLPAAFVSKAEVARWPVIGFLASAAGTVFVDREDRAAAGGFVEEMRRRIVNGGNLLVFAEGTSSRGESVLPFKSAPFAAVAGEPGTCVLPVRLDLVEIDGMPAAGALRDSVCWHGDALFVPHFLRLLAFKEIRYRVVIGTPIPCAGAGRKRLALAARERVVSLGLVSARTGMPAGREFLWFHPVP